MPHDQCQPSRRGHSWRELPLVPLSKGGPTLRELLELRRCARCGVLGRVSKQGVIHVVETP
jgi:hypothetical protein